MFSMFKWNTAKVTDVEGGFQGDSAGPAVAEAGSRAFKKVVDAIPVNVMTLSLEDFTIDYANRASIETVKAVEHLLPCKAADIVGQCIDISRIRTTSRTRP